MTIGQATARGTPMNYSTIDYRIDDGILTITLNRPEKMNAFTVQMCEELVHAFRRASDDDAVRAVIVAGSGKAFCAGMDLSVQGNVFGLDESQRPTLSELRERLDDPAILRGVRDTGGRVSLAIFDCNKPVIGAIHGAAVGVGATMTLPMDYRIAASNARIGFVFARIGIVPEACSTWFLPRLVGLPKALEWSYSGTIIEAQEAHAAGLVQKVVEPDALLDAAREVARRFTDQHSPVGIALTRQMMYRNAAQPHPLEAHLIETLAVFYLSQKDGKEGVRAFLEKRAANFTAQVSTDMPPLQPWPQYVSPR
jgi:enoyl-CoA hydratase/carnithine racemase